MLRRREMQQPVDDGGIGIAFYETAGSDKNNLTINCKFEPVFAAAWNDYRWKNANYGSNTMIVLTVVDVDHGAYTLRPYSTTAGNPVLNNVTISGKTLEASYNFGASRDYMVVALSAEAFENGVDGYVYVHEWTGDGGQSHETGCPFDPDFWCFYNTTIMDNEAGTKLTAGFRINDNVRLGYYLANSGNSTSLSMGASTISEPNDGTIVTTSRAFTSGQNYKFVAVKQP